MKQTHQKNYLIKDYLTKYEQTNKKRESYCATYTKSDAVS